VRNFLAVSSAVALAGALALGGASAAQATTTYSAPEQIEGAPANVGTSSVEYNGLLYVTVYAGGDNFPLESFDGSSFSVLPGSPNNAQNFVVWNGELFFSGLNDSGLWEIYSFDGTTFTAATDIHNSLNPEQLVVGADNELFFTADNPIHGGVTLYATFSAGVTLSGAIDAYARTTADAINGLVFFNNWVWFTAYNDDVPSLERANNTETNEVGTGLSCDAGLVWNGALYRTCSNDVLGEHLWVLTAGDALYAVAHSPLSPRELTPFDGKLYFLAQGSGEETALYSFDGSVFTEWVGGPVLPAELTVVGDTLMMSFGLSKETTDDGISLFDGAAFTEMRSSVHGASLLMSYAGSLYFSGVLDPTDPYTFWRISPVDPSAAALASTGVSAGATSVSVISGLIAGGMLLAGLGALALRRRSLRGLQN